MHLDRPIDLRRVRRIIFRLLLKTIISNLTSTALLRHNLIDIVQTKHDNREIKHDGTIDHKIVKASVKEKRKKKDFIDIMYLLSFYGKIINDKLRCRLFSSSVGADAEVEEVVWHRRTRTTSSPPSTAHGIIRSRRTQLPEIRRSSSIVSVHATENNRPFPAPRSTITNYGSRASIPTSHAETSIPFLPPY